MSQLDIQTLVLGQLDTNCYLVTDHTLGETMVIDPADDGTVITDQILQSQLQLKYIVLTHGHFDHCLGLLEVKLNFGVPILMHQADQFLLDSLPQRASHWIHQSVPPAPPVDKYLVEGNTFTLGNTQFTVLHTPGHTPGSISLLSDDLIFTGDTLFKDSIGRYDFSYSSYKDLQHSLKRLLELPPGLVVYPGHGERTEIKEEINSQLVLTAS